jgi:hypothetical protein
MFEGLVEPCPAIARRLQNLAVKRAEAPVPTAALARMPVVRRCLDAIEARDFRESLFHGFASVETYVKILLEHGFAREEEHLAKCLDLLLGTKNEDSFYERGISKVGRLLENEGHSGSQAIKASILASAGLEDEADVKQGIAHSLVCFAAVLDYKGLGDFSTLHRGKRIYRPGKLFPDYYNLRILAFTDSWKTKARMALLAASLDRLAELQPLPPVYLKQGSQLLAPGSYLMHRFDTGFSDSDDDGKAEWLQRNELLARMGILAQARGLAKVREGLADEEGFRAAAQGIRKSYSFMKWGAYTGLSLEGDWKRRERKANDLAFRLGLITFYDGRPGQKKGRPEGRPCEDRGRDGPPLGPIRNPSPYPHPGARNPSSS